MNILLIFLFFGICCEWFPLEEEKIIALTGLTIVLCILFGSFLALKDVLGLKVGTIGQVFGLALFFNESVVNFSIRILNFEPLITFLPKLGLIFNDFSLFGNYIFKRSSEVFYIFQKYLLILFLNNFFALGFNLFYLGLIKSSISFYE